MIIDSKELDELYATIPALIDSLTAASQVIDSMLERMNCLIERAQDLTEGVVLMHQMLPPHKRG